MAHRLSPRLRLAQSGSAAPQSQHAVLPGTLRRTSKVPPPATPPPPPGLPAAAAPPSDARLLLLPPATLAAPCMPCMLCPRKPAAAGTASDIPTAGPTPGDAPTPRPGEPSQMEGRLGEGCSLSAVGRDDREAASGPEPRGASPRLSAVISELMLQVEGRAAGRRWWSKILIDALYTACASSADRLPMPPNASCCQPAEKAPDGKGRCRRGQREEEQQPAGIPRLTCGSGWGARAVLGCWPGPPLPSAGRQSPPAEQPRQRGMSYLNFDFR